MNFLRLISQKKQLNTIVRQQNQMKIIQLHILIQEIYTIVLEIEQIADYVAFIVNGIVKTSDKIYNLAHFYGFNEYEIDRIDYDEDMTLKELSELLSAEKDLISDVPKILSDKIIFRTINPELVSKKIRDFKDFNFTPISGTLNKLYKQIIKGAAYEKRK